MVRIKNLIRMLLGAAYYYLGLFSVTRFFCNVSGKRLTIVTYHRITDKNINELEFSLPYLFTSATTFEKQLSFLKKWYRVITFKDLEDSETINSLPWNALIVTFDDGYEDNYRQAYPILCEMDMPATYFIRTDKVSDATLGACWWDRLYYYLEQLKHRDAIGEPLQNLDPQIKDWYDKFKHNPSALFAQVNTWDTVSIGILLDLLQEKLQPDHTRLQNENAFLQWEQIVAMQSHVLCGSHTCSHCNLASASFSLRRHELRESKRIIEQKTGQPVTTLSYPCGNVDAVLSQEVQDAGYSYAVTTKSGINDLHDRYALKRINIWEGSSLSLQGSFSKGYFALKLSGF